MAPKAVEYILHSLGACLAVGLAYNAIAAGIKVRFISIDLEGDFGYIAGDQARVPGLEAEVQGRCRCALG